MSPRVAIITNVIPLYRLDFYRRLITRFGQTLTIYCQREIPGTRLELAHDALAANIRHIDSKGLAGEKLVWQRLPVLELLRNYDILFFYGNPRVFSSVVWATLFNLLGKRVVIWGQAHTAESSPRLERMRHRWWRLFSYLFVYTDAEAEALRRQGFRSQQLIGMNNGLDQRTIDLAAAHWDGDRLERWRRDNDLQGKTILLSCARLTPKNRFAQVVTALRSVVETNPTTLWCVIGDGPEKSALADEVARSGLESHVRWIGALYHEEQLAPWFLSAAAFVHPAAIGLSLLHAYGYGLPIVTHGNDALHMPEIAALTHSNRDLCFPENDTAAMAERILWAMNNPDALAVIARDALKTARHQYNTEVMAQRFAQVMEIAGLQPPEQVAGDTSP